MATVTPPYGRGRFAFVVTAFGTLPYLALKVHWLSGGHAGVRPGLDMQSPTLMIANLVTLVLDTVVIALAWSLVGRLRPRTVRLVAPLVWGATGLMATPVLTYLIVLVTDPALAAGTDLAPWVYAAVYGSFAAQAAGLLTLLLLRMHQPRTSQHSRRASQTIAMLSSVAVGAWYLRRAAGGPLLAGDSAALDPVGRVGAAVTGALALASALSLMMISRSVRSQWMALAWVSSGAMACFSGYLLLIGLLTPQPPHGAPRPLLVATLLSGAIAALTVRREFHRRLTRRRTGKATTGTAAPERFASAAGDGRVTPSQENPDVTPDRAGASDR